MKLRFIGLSKIIISLLILSMVLLMSNCRRTVYVAVDVSDRLPRRVETGSDPTVIKMLKYFNDHGIKVVTIGQDYLISLPSAALFADQSPRLTWESYGLLNDVARFMKLFRKVSVTVTGYSNKYVSCKREQALTLARARSVANYLWTQCVDSRLIFVEGAGSDKPIAGTRQGGDRAINSRIEITFRDAIV